MAINDNKFDSRMDYKIKQMPLVITNYFNQNPELCKVPARDLMPSFIEAGLFTKDHRQGLPIRNLLREMDRNGQLEKFPFILADRKAINTNWYFTRPKKHQIGITDLLHHNSVNALSKAFHQTITEKENVRYNLFTLSNRVAHYENFHSDIIASLLNPNGMHNSGDIFLMLFLKYLNDHYETSLDPHNFKNVAITREEGRLDIFIKDLKSQQAIIIENKINNAPDMVDQIDRYHEYASTRDNLEVKAIIYLTIDGLKYCPTKSNALLPVIKNIGAFANNPTDLFEGWIEPCIESAENIETKSLLIQYGKLIKHLGNKNMDSTTLQQFYQFINENNGLGTVEAIINLSQRIPEYRADKFARSIGKDIEPFKRRIQYQANYWLFEGFLEGQSNFKLDVCFESDGSVWLLFWDQNQRDQIGFEAVARKLKTVDILGLFDIKLTFGYQKKFALSEMYPTMDSIDNEVESFVKSLFNKLSVTN